MPGAFYQNTRNRRPQRNTGIVDWTPERLRALAQKLQLMSKQQAAEELAAEWKTPVPAGSVSALLQRYGGKTKFIDEVLTL